MGFKLELAMRYTKTYAKNNLESGKAVGWSVALNDKNEV